MNDNKFAYPTGALRARETSLIGKAKINIFLDAESPQDLLRLLSETCYGDFITEDSHAEDFEQILHLGFVRECNFIKEITPEPNITNLFFMKFDFINAKGIAKSIFLKEEPLIIYEGIGLVSSEDMLSWASGDSKAKLYPALEGVWNGIIKDMKGIDTREIEIRFDKGYLHYALKKAETYRLLLDFYKCWIDLVNITSFLRYQKLSEDSSILDPAFIYGGYLEKNRFRDLWKEEMIKGSDFTLRYKDILENALEEYIIENSLDILEKGRDNFLLGRLEAAKYLSFAPEPFYVYLLAREIEVRILRTLFVGKLNNMHKERIRNLLRMSYV